MLLAMEISFTTPPFGLLLFVMQGAAPPGTRFGEICLAALPFMACALLLTMLIVVFPDLAVWLPWLGGRGRGASRRGELASSARCCLLSIRRDGM